MSPKSILPTDGDSQMSLSNDGCTYRDEKEDHSRFRSKKPIEDGATILDILTYLSHPVHSLIGSGQLLEQITTRFKSIAKSGHRAYPEDDREKDRKSLRDLLTTWQANNSAKQKYPDCLDKPLPKDLQDSLNIMRSWYNTKQDLSGYETNDLYDKVVSFPHHTPVHTSFLLRLADQAYDFKSRFLI